MVGIIKRNVTFDKENFKLYSYDKGIHYFPNFGTLDFINGKTEFKILKDDTYYRFRVHRLDFYNSDGAGCVGEYYLVLYHERKRTSSVAFLSFSLSHLFQDVYDYIFC